MGDGIMALWGAPVEPPGRRRSAACSARSSRWRCSASSTAARVERGRPPLAIGIGIHTGPLVAGYIGSSKALSYTVIGDTANTASRIEGLTRDHGPVLASMPTYEQARDDFAWTPAAVVRVKGKAEPVATFTPPAATRR